LRYHIYDDQVRSRTFLLMYPLLFKLELIVIAEIAAKVITTYVGRYIGPEYLRQDTYVYLPMIHNCTLHRLLPQFSRVSYRVPTYVAFKFQVYIIIVHTTVSLLVY
jgi:hypothetical protein